MFALNRQDLKFFVKMMITCRGVAKIFQTGGGSNALSHSGYLHSPLQMLGPANGACNYLALEKIYGMSTLRIRNLFA